MATFQKLKFKELLEQKNSVKIKKNQQYSFIPMENVESGLKYPRVIENKIFNGSGSRFMNGDILFARITPCLQNKKIVKVKDLKSEVGFGSTEFFIFRAKRGFVDPDYLYYTTKLEDLINTAISSMVGASGRQRADIKSIYEYVVNVPDFLTQTRIASILSSYDDLIENNEKRIKILEEMAQFLYTEWFVKFKFPDHEKVKMVDSGTEYGKIPERWEITTFGDSLDIKYGKTLSTTKIGQSGKYDVYGAGKIIGYYDQKNIDTKTPLITCRGNGSGTVWRTFGEGFVTNNSFTVIGKNKEMGFEFIFNCLKNCNIFSAISGSAQPQITIESINFVKFILPPTKLMKNFIENTSKLYQFSDKLRQENKILSKVRDLLIPQLVTGKRELK